MKDWSFDWEHAVEIPNPNYDENKPRSKKVLTETAKCLELKLYYFSLPLHKRTKKTVAEHFNYKNDSVVRRAAKKYHWDDTEKEEQEYYAWLSQTTLKEAQDALLETIQSEVKEEIKLIRFALMDLSVKLGFIPHPQTKVKEQDPEIDYIKGINAYKSLVSSLKGLRAMAYRAVGLADKLNAPQTTRIINDEPLQDLSEFVEDKEKQDEIFNDI